MTNVGDAALAGTWQDRLYLSADPNLSEFDTILQIEAINRPAGLAPNDSYAINRTIVIPDVDAGTYYLFVKTLAVGAGDGDASNNVVMLGPVTISKPDLVVTQVDGPSSAVGGQTVSVTYTVTNDSDTPMGATGITDRIVLSDDQTIDLNDQLLTLIFIQSDTLPLAAHGSYQRTVDVQIPAGSTGAKYLILRTNTFFGSQGETTRANNDQAIPINLSSSDLVVESVVVPPAATFGTPFDVTYTVRNIGSGPTTQTQWYDRMAFSSPDTSVSVIFSDILVTLDHSLAPGESYTRTITANVNPIAASGQYRIGVAADILNAQPEIDDNNNVLLSNLFDVTLPPVPDLVVSSIVAPVEGFSGQQFALTWTVTNTGNAVANAPWTDRVTLSGPQVINLGSFQSLVSLAPGQSITRTELFDFPLTDGSYVISVKTDDGNAILEGPNESNTAFTSSILITTPPLPDLVVTHIVAPSDGIFSGQTVPITFTVSNIGQTATQTPIWSDYVFVSSNPGIVYPDPVADDLLIVDQPNTTLLSLPNPTYLEPGQSYTQTVDVTIPTNAAGSWYVYVFPNGLGKFYSVPVALRESDRTNNLTRSDAFQVNLTPPPDLVVTQVIAPSTTFSGQSATVQWTVTNAGPGDTPATLWSDRVYLSADDQLGVGDVLLTTLTAQTSFRFNGPLHSGDSYVNSANLVLPEGLSGTYYFFVVTDTGNAVFEAGSESNNVSSRPTNVILTPPPDLVVDSVTTAPSALSGHSIDVTYTVTNRGNTSTPAVSTLDRIYLSADTEFDANDTLLASATGLFGELGVDESYTRTRSITLPVGIEGIYHFIVVASDSAILFELNRDNNVLASDPIDVQSILANLSVTSLDIESTAVAGQLTTVSWTVSNTGTGDTESTLWLDKVFVSTTGSTSGGRLVGSFVHNGILASGQSYSQSAGVLIPFDVAGNAQIYVVTDAVVLPTDASAALPVSPPYGRVYEGAFENDNTSSLASLLIVRDTPDLVLAEITAPSVALTGQSINVSWIVQNAGGLTNADHWTDDVYLSLDPNLSADDVLLGSVFHSGDSANNDSYLASLDVKLPDALMAGNYFVIVQADRTVPRGLSDPLVNRVFEGAVEANNIKASAVAITLSDVPNLTVSSVLVPDTSIAGRSLDVSWTVTNSGASTGDRTWKDAVYLSGDQFLNTNTDRFLGYVNHVGGLDANAQYTADGSFAIPGGLTGPYYVFVLTDASNTIFERGGEGDNTAYAPQSVDLLFGQPVDFVVGSIQVPTNATPGAQATIVYTVNNNINLAVPGGWTDAIYLSQDDVWDSSDTLFGRVQRPFDLAAGASYTENIVAPLPILAPGSYHIIIRTDVLNNVVETVDSNNIGVSLDVAAVDAVALTLGVERTDLLLEGGFILYRVNVPAGETLRFSWDATNNNSATEMFVRFGAPPTRSLFDLRSTDPFATDPQVVLPESQAGTYFVLVRSNQFSNVGKMLVETVPFSVSNVSPHEVGNAGPVTLEIDGALFTRGTTFELVSSSGAVVQATLSLVVGSTKAYATFDLRGKATGAYDLVARSVDGSVAMEEDAVEVVTATLGGVFSAGVNVPPFELADALDSFFITFSNTGSSDLIAPLLTIRSSTGTLFGRNQPAVGAGEEIVLFGASPDGPAGIIRPGQSITIPFVFRAPPAGALNYSFELFYFDENDQTPIDWQNVLDLMDPRVQAQNDFNQIFAQLKSQIGSTMGQYVQMLSRNANLAPTLDDARNDGALLDIEVQRAIAAVRTSLRGSIVTDDLDVVISDRLIAATNVDTGEVITTRTYRDGSFLFANIPSGIYEFKVEGAVVPPGQFYIVDDGEHASGFELAVERGLRISGQVLDGLIPIEAASVTALGQDGSVFTVNSDSSGHFVLSGLVGGIYSISVNVEGYAEFQRDGIDVSTADVTTTAVLTKGGTIVGSVILPPGGATDTEMLIIATRSDNQVSAVSTFTSVYRLDGLLDGVYEVRIVRPGYVPVVLNNVSVVAGQTQVLNNTTLVQAAIVRGQITSPDPAVSTSFLPVSAYLGDELVAVVQADATGAYVFDELPAGAYDLKVGEVSLLSDTVSVISAIANDTLANIAVHSGATIFGVVCLGADQSPVPGIQVSLLQPDGSLTQIETDSSGYYQFDRLASGDYVVFLGSIGDGSFQSISVTQIDGDLIEADLSITSLAEVVGQVTTSTGEPIADAFITVIQNGQTVAYTFTDESGNYRFLFFGVGTYEIRAFADNASFNPATSVILGVGSLAQVDFVAGESTLVIQATFAGQAASGAIATLTTESGIGVDVLLDENGLALVQNLVAGTYTLQVRNADGAESTTTVVIGQAQDQSVQVDLVAQSVLRGTITGPGGINVDGASVIIYAAGTNQASAQGRTDINGQYQIQFLKPGTYDIIAYSSGLRYQLVTGVAINGQTMLNLSLAASTNQVSLAVQDATGRGIPFAFVTVRDTLGRVIDSVSADESGVALLTSAFGANLSLQVFATGYSPSVATPLELTAPGSTDSSTIQMSPVALAAAVSSGEGFAGFASRVEEVTFASFQATAAQNSPWVKRLQDVRLERVQSWLKRLATLHFGDPVCPESVPLWKEAGAAVKQFRDSVTKATNLGRVAIEKAKEFTKTAAKAATEIVQAGTDLYRAAKNVVINPADTLEYTYADTVLFPMVRTQSLNLLRAFDLLTSATSSTDALQRIEPVKAIYSTISSGLESPFLIKKNPFPAIDLALANILQAINAYIDAAEAAGNAEEAFNKESERADAFGLFASDAVSRYIVFDLAHRNCNNNPGGGGGSKCGTGFGILAFRIDPNEITGPVGYGDPRFVSATDALNYTINFENLKTASVPVQTLTITTQLDSDLDYRTVRFGSFGFRGLTFELPVSQPFISQRVDLTDTLGFFVDVIATVNVTTGLATWTLTAIDPATGEEPRDERIGFLPPNTNDGLGEGFVTYSVRAKSSASTGDTIDAKATIIFDTELPLDTPVWTNSLDSVAPTSQVVALPEVSPLPTFILSWTASDAPGGSGLANTSIYVSENAGDYRLLVVADASVRQFFFEGKAGKSYSFLSVAEDNAGNR
ncbi:carboxypeptidase regulatory-like domain-containing protein, partial [bacterium]|nr:carboxypeptidase regulatory-like domain-containing protein [bacterium]